MKSKILKSTLIAICIAVVLVVIIVGIIHLIPPSAKKVYKNSIDSVVELKAYSEDVGESFGTAIFVKEDGRLVTNAHVVTYKRIGIVNTFDEYSIRFAYEENYREVELVKYDVEKDLAVLKLKGSGVEFETIDVGDSEDLDFGEKVYAIGNGSNYGLSITQGIVSIPKINIEYDGVKREVIQCDLTISAGNSGGALLDKKGKLIGITTFRTKDNQGEVIYGLVYSIPIRIVLEYVGA